MSRTYVRRSGVGPGHAWGTAQRPRSTPARARTTPGGHSRAEDRAGPEGRVPAPFRASVCPSGGPPGRPTGAGPSRGTGPGPSCSRDATPTPDPGREGPVGPPRLPIQPGRAARSRGPPPPPDRWGSAMSAAHAPLSPPTPSTPRPSPRPAPTPARPRVGLLIGGAPAVAASAAAAVVAQPASAANGGPSCSGTSNTATRTPPPPPRRRPRLAVPTRAPARPRTLTSYFGHGPMSAHAHRQPIRRLRVSSSATVGRRWRACSPRRPDHGAYEVTTGGGLRPSGHPHHPRLRRAATRLPSPRPATPANGVRRHHAERARVRAGLGATVPASPPSVSPTRDRRLRHRDRAGTGLWDARRRRARTR